MLDMAQYYLIVMGSRLWVGSSYVLRYVSCGSFLTLPKLEILLFE
jgi:hypothetical protein